MEKTIQIVGPYFTNYSLAKVNRELALAINALNSEYKAFLYCDPEAIDYQPSADEISKRQLTEVVKLTPTKTDIAIYNNFPKTLTSLHGLKDLNADVKLMYIAWEDVTYPTSWVEEINENLHGVMATTSFVRDVLIDSGVRVPIKVVSNALDPELKKEQSSEYKLNTNKKFKFIHISSAKQRKGVDLLIKAYFSEFTKDDNCVLVIKSFPGPDNVVEQLLAENKTDSSPEVVHIPDPNLTEAEIANLTSSCDCAVYPTRGEGFGLPILEAMQLEVPVIVTGYSGHMDFCSEENAYLLDYKLELASKNEIVNLNSYWAEPDFDQLKVLMKKVYNLRIEGAENLPELEELNQKVKNAKETADSIRWEASAKESVEFLNSIQKSVAFKDKNFATLTFLNDQTGISSYSKELYKNIEKSFNNFYYLANQDIADRTELDSTNVVRNWSTGDTDFTQLVEFLSENKIEIFHIQYHTGEFAPSSLNTLLENIKNLSIKTFITLHSVTNNKELDVIKDCPNLKLVQKVIFHNQADLDYAAKTLNNVVLMRIPRISYKNRNRANLKATLGLENYYPIIATHGLLNTNKGVDNVISAVAMLKDRYPNILFLGLNAVSPNNIWASALYKQLQEQIQNLKLQSNAVLVDEFLDKKVIEIILQCGDINVLAYVDTAGESASAAIEKTLASLKPTIVTDIKAFEELNKEVFKIKDNSVENITTAVENLLSNKELYKQIVGSAKVYIKNFSYLNKALETLEIYF